jgi:hemolysin activation/secretion protein
VFFIDHGYTSRDDTLVEEPTETSLTGAGLGMRYFLDTPYVDGLLRVDMGWPLESTDGLEDEDPVLYFSTELNY